MARLDDPDARLLRALRTAANGEDEPCPAGLLAAAAGLPGVEALEARLGGLRAAGYRIEGGAAGGWRLLAAPAALIADDLLATLAPSPGRIIGREIVVFEETDSTNDVAARAGHDGCPEGLVIFAEKQRAGRGRLGRVWKSPPRQGLLLSVLLRPPAVVPAARWSELTFCAALAVAGMAERVTGQPARIKWPNDVLMHGRKVAGILLERHQRDEPGFVVVGIGVNVLQTAGDFDPALRETAGSLAMMMMTPPDATRSTSPPERRVAAAALLDNLERLYRRWPAGFGEIMRACEERGCVAPAASPGAH